jgi:hypothetical protein
MQKRREEEVKTNTQANEQVEVDAAPSARTQPNGAATSNSLNDASDDSGAGSGASATLWLVAVPFLLPSASFLPSNAVGGVKRLQDCSARTVCMIAFLQTGQDIRLFRTLLNGNLASRASSSRRYRSHIVSFADWYVY